MESGDLASRELDSSVRFTRQRGCPCEAPLEPRKGRAALRRYRGSPTRTSPLPGNFNEGTTGPTQKTHYDNTEDTSKDPDNPAADGQGSRHNYTVIGQTGLTYDNNRNVLADGTREFRYSYNNQLRRVWRKSDGIAASNGLLAKYRECPCEAPLEPRCGQRRFAPLWPPRLRRKLLGALAPRCHGHTLQP